MAGDELLKPTLHVEVLLKSTPNSPLVFKEASFLNGTKLRLDLTINARYAKLWLSAY